MKSLGWWTQSINSRLSRQKDPIQQQEKKHTHTHYTRMTRTIYNSRQQYTREIERLPYPLQTLTADSQI